MNILPYHKSRSSGINNELSSSWEPSVTEKLKNETLNPSFDNTHPTSSNPSTASTQTSDEKASSRDVILIRLRQHDANGTPFKKAPVPLPRPVIQHQKGSTSSESSSVSQETTLHQVTPPDENTYAEVSNEVVKPSFYSNVIEMRASYEPFERPDMSLPNSVATDLRKSFHYDSESLSTPLDVMLPLKCMFYEFETMIDEYINEDILIQYNLSKT